MRRLRTNNEFKLRVLIYLGFTVLLILFLKFSVSKSLFVLIFIEVSFYFAGNLSKAECRDFERRNAEETTYGACDGPSCSWRSLGGSVVQLLKEDREVWPSVGLRSLWRSVLQVRHEVQRSNPSTHIPRVEVFWNEDPRRTVVPVTICHTCRRG